MLTNIGYLNTISIKNDFPGYQIAQPVKRWTLEVEVPGLKPEATGGGVGSHLISTIRKVLCRR